jgi:hypothetical protein
MADGEPEEDGPLTIAEEWRASLVGLQLQFQKQILSVLIDKGFLTGEEARLSRETPAGSRDHALGA